MVADWIAAGLDPERARSSSSRWSRSTPSCSCSCRWCAGPVARARADLQGAAGDLKDRDLSTLGFLGYPLLQTADIIDLRREVRPGRRGPGRAPRAVARDRAPLQQRLRRDVRRAAAAADDGLAPARARRRQDVSKSFGNTIHLSDDAETVRKRVRQMYTDPKRVRPTFPAPSREPGVHLSRRVQSRYGGSRRPEGALSGRQGRGRRGQDQAGEGAERAPRPDPRARAEPSSRSPAPSRRFCTKDRRRRGSWPTRPWSAFGRDAVSDFGRA